MRYLVVLPFAAVSDTEHFMSGRPLTDWAVAVEAAGFDGIAVTDHPFPSTEWLATGGHHAFDPFTVLTAFGVVTSRVRLVTDVLVAGYRNPYLVAKSVASVDRLSGGRFTLGIAAGYQRAEFDALGASFDDRGERFDEALAAITAALTGEPVVRDEGHYPARGNVSLPRPLQQPRPPIWIGGNARAATRRAVQLADGWMPFHQSPRRVSISLAPVLDGLPELRDRIAEANERRAALAAPPLDVCVSMFDRPEPDAFADHVAQYSEAGVTWIRLMSGAKTYEASIEELQDLARSLGLPSV